MIKYFEYNQELRLESGQSLPRFTLAYQTFGNLNKNKSNAIWVIHALTGDSNVTDWWDGVVGPGKAIDTNQYFVVCANTLGSHYGSTCSLSINPKTGHKYYHDFPTLTNRDITRSFSKLADHLQLESISSLIGPSLGGQQALEWSILEPQRFNKLVLIATNALHSAYGIAFNESQRMAIELDPTWHNNTDASGINGMKVARSVALISYRTKYGYDHTQQEETNEMKKTYKASSYQRYQGEKLAQRFNAYSYYQFSKAMDSHNLGRGRTSIEDTLSSLKIKTLIIGIDSDILFPAAEQEYLAKHIRDSQLEIISSKYGHDGFLTESDIVSKLLHSFLDEAVDVESELLSI